MTTLGEAFIEVHADTSPFARELGVELKTILDAVGKKGNQQAAAAGRKITEGLDSGIAAKFPLLRRRFTTLGNWLDELRDRIDKQGGLRQAFDRLAKGNFILTRLFGSFALKVGGAIKRVGALAKGMLTLVGGIDLVFQGLVGLVSEGFKAFVGVSADFAKVQSTLALGFTRIGTALAAAAAEAIAAAPAIAAMVAVVAALAAALGVLFLALTVALAPFAGLLTLALAIPAAFSALLAIIFPLTIAMADLGEAMKLVFETDPEKFAKGMEKLPPIMQRLVKTLRPFRTEFTKLRDTVQEAFFAPILAQLGPTLNKVLSGLTEGLATIAGSLGLLVSKVMAALSDPAVFGMIQAFMFTIADFIRTHSDTFVSLLLALGEMANAALPVVLLLLTKFGDFISKFVTWITEAIADGRFEKWLDTGIKALGTIWRLVKALIGLFAALFSETQTGGRDFLDTITRAVEKFTNWIKSPEGKKALEQMVKLAQIIARAFEVALGFVIQMVSKVAWLVDKIDWINKHTGNPLGALGKAAQWAGGFSGGGIVPHDGLAMVHNNEAILDPANPDSRNRAILAEAGMLDILEPQAPVVNVFIGNEQLDARTDYRISRANQRTARALATGPRS